MTSVQYTSCDRWRFFLWSIIFFFKQKTAYGVRISDWSSDVCSSDLNAGAMAFSAVMLTPQAATEIHERFRGVTGLRGELKGSRISIVERAYLLELFDRAGGRAWVAVAKRDKLAENPGGTLPSDLAL